MINNDFLVYPTICKDPELPSLIDGFVTEYRESCTGSQTSVNNDIFSYVQFRLSKTGTFFRKRADSQNLIVAKWVSLIYNKSLMIIGSNSPVYFQGITKDYLRDVARLSPDPNVIKELPIKLLKSGIILIYEPSLSSLKVDGVAFNLMNKYFVIGISFRFPRLDHFWFTLLHELSHAYLHYSLFEQARSVDLQIGFDVEELAANKLAKESFVEKHIWANCPPKYERSEQSIIEFAKKQGVHPSIIAGMLQREQHDYKIYRRIVDSIDTRKLVFNNE